MLNLLLGVTAAARALGLVIDQTRVAELTRGADGREGSGHLCWLGGGLTVGGRCGFKFCRGQPRQKQKRVFLNHTELIFPAREYEVLSQLMTPPGRTVSKKEMSSKLSDFDDVLGDNALETFISRLRKKIQGSGVSIRTLRGLGYLLEEEKNEPY